MKYDIFCINLINRKDRLDKMKELFEKLNIKDKINFHIVEKHVKGGKYGCFNSHIECLEKSTGDYTIIFEDDCIINVDFKWDDMIKLIDKYFSDTYNYEYFSIANCPFFTYKTLDVKNNIIKSNFIFANAYALKKSCYNKLKKDIKSYIGYIHIDQYYFIKINNKIGFCKQYFIQNFYDSNNEWSTIYIIDLISRYIASNLNNVPNKLILMFFIYIDIILRLYVIPFLSNIFNIIFQNNNNQII